MTWEQQLHWTSAVARSDAALGQHPVLQFSAAFLAGGFSTALFQPTEVIKTRLQLARLTSPMNLSAATSTATAAAAAAASASSVPIVAPSRHRVLAMTARIYAEDGLSGFFRGLAPRIIKRSLSNACGWMIFEQLVQFWSGTTGL